MLWKREETLAPAGFRIPDRPIRDQALCRGYCVLSKRPNCCVEDTRADVHVQDTHACTCTADVLYTVTTDGARPTLTTGGGTKKMRRFLVWLETMTKFRWLQP